MSFAKRVRFFGFFSLATCMVMVLAPLSIFFAFIFCFMARIIATGSIPKCRLNLLSSKCRTAVLYFSEIFPFLGNWYCSFSFSQTRKSSPCEENRILLQSSSFFTGMSSERRKRAGMSENMMSFIISSPVFRYNIQNPQ